MFMSEVVDKVKRFIVFMMSIFGTLLFNRIRVSIFSSVSKQLI
ncbi:hypothetical protein [Bacillus sp. T33-2]|nr:hypothetical protein [Bacillus sp. T33-2]